MDAKWLRSISLGGVRARKGIYEVKKQMMTGSETWGHRRRKIVEARKQHKTQNMLKDTAKL